MYEYYFTFRSVTKAQQAMSVLKDHGFFSILVRAPKFAAQYGCGHALRLIGNDPTGAVLVLRNASLQQDRIFQVVSGGLAQEVTL